MSLNRPQLLLIILALVGFCTAYYGALDVPFYLDDRSSITHNRFFDNASLSSLFNAYGMRTVGYVTLWLNFLHSSTEPWGYHFVNLMIHALNGILIAVLTYKLLHKTHPDVKPEWLLFIGSCAGVLFVLHPLNSQAAVYVVQRLASLVTLFYLGSLVCYFSARTSKTVKRSYVWFLASSCFALLALFTKQNAVTLPIALLLLEVFVFSSIRMRIPFIIGCVLISVFWLGLSTLDEGSIFHMIDAFTRETDAYSRWEYVLVQSPIITLYVQKFFIPIDLHLDYGLRLSSFTESQKIGALLVHIALLAGALIVRRKFPLVTFGVVLFYLLHIVESGFIPITDLAFEHRTYLPNIALIVLLCAITSLFIIKLEASHFPNRIVMTTVLLLVLMGTWLTNERVQEWKEPKLFYTTEMERSPNNVRTLHNFAEYLIREGNNTDDKVKAGSLLDKMYEYSDGSLDGVMVNTHIVYLMGTQEYRKAMTLGESLMKQKLHPVTSAIVKENMGVVYTTLGDYRKALDMFNGVRQFERLKVSSRIAYSFALYKSNRKGRAIQVAKSIFAIDPSNKKAQELIDLISAN